MSDLAIRDRLEDKMGKKMTKGILERDAKRNLGQELLQAVREIKAGKTGRVLRRVLKAA